MKKKDQPSITDIAKRLKEAALFSDPVRKAALSEPGAIGVLEADVPVGKARGPKFEATMLFEDAALETALERFEELGLAHLLDSSCAASMHRHELSNRIARALGVRKPDVQPFDFDPLPENEAWFLNAFASIFSHTGLDDPEMAEPFRDDENGLPLDFRDFARALELKRCLALIELGRLLQWWRWRSKGHDAEASLGQRFDPKRPGREKLRATSKQKYNRNEKIIKRARKLLKMGEGRAASTGRINISRLARLAIDSLSLDIKKTRVSEIIRKAIRDGKLTE